MALIQTAFLAPADFELELSQEIARHKSLKIIKKMGSLFITQSETRPPTLFWAQNTWHHVQHQKISSIGQAVKILKPQKRVWSLYSQDRHRRCLLIQEQIPHIKNKKYDFLQALPKANLGAWTLEEDDTLWWSKDCTSALPQGEIHFNEDKDTPPSRAYLKLWEAFTVFVSPPKKGECAIDLGSSPGGWTWVLHELGCQVISVDKAPLHKSLWQKARIEWIEKDAFKLAPGDFPRIDWILSDIICEPQKLYQLVTNWRQAHPKAKMICTLKFKGKTDYKAIELFAAIPGGRLVHLYHNKHELTWIYAPEP